MADSTAAAMRTARTLAFVGLACGLVYAFGGLVYDLSTTGLSTGTALAFLAIVGMPLGFGILGFLLALVPRAVVRLLTKSRLGPGP